jgi:hypothetical protein
MLWGTRKAKTLTADKQQPPDLSWFDGTASLKFDIVKGSTDIEIVASQSEGGTPNQQEVERQKLLRELKAVERNRQRKRDERKQRR